VSSTRNPGRVAGFLHLLLCLSGPIRLIYIPGKLFVHGNAAATAGNIAAHESLFRFGIVSDLFAGVIVIFVALAAPPQHAFRSSPGFLPSPSCRAFPRNDSRSGRTTPHSPGFWPIIVFLFNRIWEKKMKKAFKMPAKRVTITKPFRAVAYLAKVHSFESVNYLDMGALSRAKHAIVEIGTAETHAGSITVVAHIRDGAIVALAPKGCADCHERKGKKPGKALLKSASHAFARAGIGRLGGPKLPIPITPTTTVAALKIGSITITSIDVHWFDICIYYTTDDGSFCYWCLFGGSGCVDAISGA